MVVMKNITQTKKYISMDCYKDGREEDHFFITIDIQTNKVIENTLPNLNIYSRHAIAKVLKLKAQGPLPKEAVAVWY